MRRGAAIWLGVVAVCASGASSAGPAASVGRAAASEFPIIGPFRLPHTFEPTRYRARIALGDRSFEGHIEIEGELAADVSLIWLHGVDLVASRALATRGDPAERADVATLLAGAPELPNVLAEIDACLATRAALEPQLRAWLTAMGPGSRTAK